MKLCSAQFGVKCAAGQEGGSRLNFLIVIVIIGVAAYCVAQYAPVAYNAFAFKDFMQETVNKAAYPPGQSAAWIESQLRANAKENDLPENMTIKVQKTNGQLTTQVEWTKSVPLPGYIYEYKFDHTVKSSTFLNPQ